MKYLNIYKSGTESSFNIFSDLYIPNVSLIENNKQIQLTRYHDYSNDYFTIVALANCTIDVDLIEHDDPEYPKYSTIQYSLDNGNTWSEEFGSLENISVSNGSKLLLKGAIKTGYKANGVDQLGELHGGYIKSTGKYKVEGNIMSLFYGDNFSDKTTITDDTILYKFFANDKKIVAAHNLILPITVMPNEYALTEMFSGCTSLVTSPKILPATTLAYYCYLAMFKNCKSLITVPELPATTLGYECYKEMFIGCTSLTKVPNDLLPARILKDKHDYDADSCYNEMFSGCTSLITAPELPATSLADYCYQNMFENCTSLVKAPELPADSLRRSCYKDMFLGCTSLVKAPDLVASYPSIDDCYDGMFANCTSLNYIKCYAAYIDDNSDSFDSWLYNVAQNGTFIGYDEEAVNKLNSLGCIPDGWKIEYIDDWESGESGSSSGSTSNDSSSS